MEEKQKKQELFKGSRLILLIRQKEWIPSYSAPRAYILPPTKKNYKKKKQNRKLLQGTDEKKTERRQKKSQKIKNSMNSVELEQCAGGQAFCRMRNFAGCEIEQHAKFCRLRNFCNPAKFLKFFHFLLFFPSGI